MPITIHCLHTLLQVSTVGTTKPDFCANVLLYILYITVLLKLKKVLFNSLYFHPYGIK